MLPIRVISASTVNANANNAAGRDLVRKASMKNGIDASARRTPKGSVSVVGANTRIYK